MVNFDKIIKNGRKKMERLSGRAGNDYCSGMMSLPGLGWAGSGVSYTRNKKMFENYQIKSQIIGDNFTPDTTSFLFGFDLSAPIMVAPMSGIKSNLNGFISEKVFLKMILTSCSKCGMIGMCGDSFDTTQNYDVPELLSQNDGIAVCKPRSFDEIKKRIMLLKKVHVKVIGIDLDGIGGVFLSNEKKVFRKNAKELKEIRLLYHGPMFLKGILSLNDAQIAHDCGYDGVVVSNHGGRSFDYAAAPLSVLSQIAKTFKGKMTILVDGGISNGFETFICLALGADGVLIGREAVYAVVGGGRPGLISLLRKMQNELVKAMLFSNCRKISDISQKCIENYV
ncbi:TPA: hypothetical protein DF272_03950 [Candidatus Falkowbacteria bacterium]|nr:hypothetical protein [Candidatus Falkowbacteria bacterium]